MHVHFQLYWVRARREVQRGPQAARRQAVCGQAVCGQAVCRQVACGPGKERTHLGMGMTCIGASVLAGGRGGVQAVVSVMGT